MHGCLWGVIQCGGGGVTWFRDGGGVVVQGGKIGATIPPPHLPLRNLHPLLSSSSSFSFSVHRHHLHLLFQEAGLASLLTCPQASG